MSFDSAVDVLHVRIVPPGHGNPIQFYTGKSSISFITFSRIAVDLLFLLHFEGFLCSTKEIHFIWTKHLTAGSPCSSVHTHRMLSTRRNGWQPNKWWINRTTGFLIPPRVSRKQITRGDLMPSLLFVFSTKLWEYVTIRPLRGLITPTELSCWSQSQSRINLEKHKNSSTAGSCFRLSCDNGHDPGLS